MKRRAGMIASAAAAAIVAASTFALLQNSDGSSPDGDSSRSDVASRFSDDHPAVRGCRDRVEGGKIAPDRTVDTVIGPMAFIRLPDAYRDEAARPDSELKPYPPVGMPTMKVIGVLRAGARVRLVVPRRQRRWMKVVYDYPDHKGGYAITLQACNRLRSPRARRRECGWRPDLACRWHYTQFSGGFGLDFAKAPRRGVCAQLVVRVKGNSEPLRDFLLDPMPGACRGDKPATGGARPAPSDGKAANTTGRSEPIKSTPARSDIGERPDYFVPGPARGPLALLGCARLGVSGKPVEFSGNLARLDARPAATAIRHPLCRPATTGRSPVRLCHLGGPPGSRLCAAALGSLLHHEAKEPA
jgi:hypothetical protein